MIPDALLDRAPIIIHIAQFEHRGIPDKPQLFTDEEEMYQWVSDQLHDTSDPLFVRRPDESPHDHVHALLDHQREHRHGDINPEEAERGCSWRYEDDILRLWEAEIKPKPTPPAPNPVNPEIL